jgi:hypothetical protein
MLIFESIIRKQLPKPDQNRHISRKEKKRIREEQSVIRRFEICFKLLKPNGYTIESDSVDFYPTLPDIALRNGLQGKQIVEDLNQLNYFGLEEFLPNDMVMIWLEYSDWRHDEPYRPIIPDYLLFIKKKSWHMLTGFEFYDYEYKVLQAGRIKFK